MQEKAWTVGQSIADCVHPCSIYPPIHPLSKLLISARGCGGAGGCPSMHLVRGRKRPRQVSNPSRPSEFHLSLFLYLSALIPPLSLSPLPLIRSLNLNPLILLLLAIFFSFRRSLSLPLSPPRSGGSCRLWPSLLALSPWARSGQGGV